MTLDGVMAITLRYFTLGAYSNNGQTYVVNVQDTPPGDPLQLAQEHY